MKKILSIILIIVLQTFPITVLADDEIEEINSDEITEEIEQVSNLSTDMPYINSRAAIVIERNSLVPIYEKNANERRKMASTTKIV